MSNPNEISYKEWLEQAQVLVRDDQYLDCFDWNFYYITGADPFKAKDHYDRAKAYCRKVNLITRES